VTELGREAPDDEIAEVTGIDPEGGRLDQALGAAPVSLGARRATRRVGVRPFIADERAESPYERAAEILTRRRLREALETLSYRERRVRASLRARWRAPAHPRRGRRTFNVTRGGIRQIANHR